MGEGVSAGQQTACQGGDERLPAKMMNGV
jgi:hypothetical protein